MTKKYDAVDFKLTVLADQLAGLTMQRSSLHQMTDSLARLIDRSDYVVGILWMRRTAIERRIGGDMANDIKTASSLHRQDRGPFPAHLKPVGVRARMHRLYATMNSVKAAEAMWVNKTDMMVNALFQLLKVDSQLFDLSAQIVETLGIENTTLPSLLNDRCYRQLRLLAREWRKNHADEMRGRDGLLPLGWAPWDVGDGRAGVYSEVHDAFAKGPVAGDSDNYAHVMTAEKGITNNPEQMQLLGGNADLFQVFDEIDRGEST